MEELNFDFGPDEEQKIGSALCKKETPQLSESPRIPSKYNEEEWIGHKPQTRVSVKKSTKFVEKFKSLAQNSDAFGERSEVRNNDSCSFINLTEEDLQ